MPPTIYKAGASAANEHLKHPPSPFATGGGGGGGTGVFGFPQPSPQQHFYVDPVSRYAQPNDYQAVFRSNPSPYAATGTNWPVPETIDRSYDEGERNRGVGGSNQLADFRAGFTTPLTSGYGGLDAASTGLQVPLPMPPSQNLVRSLVSTMKEQQKGLVGATQSHTSHATGTKEAAATTTVLATGASYEHLSKPTASSLARKAAVNPKRTTSPAIQKRSAVAAAAPTTTAQPADTAAMYNYRQPSPSPSPPQMAATSSPAQAAEPEAVALLIKYKHYVDTKLTPQLQRSLDEADALREELTRRNKELEEVTNELDVAKDVGIQLRMVLDQQRLSTDGTHKDHLKLMAQSHQAEVKRLTAELNAIQASVSASSVSDGKLVQLERLLELRDGELRKLRLQLTQQQQQQQANKSEQQLTSGDEADALSEEGFLMGSDPTTSNILSTVATELEGLVQESLGYALAMNAACQQAGVADVMGPAAIHWRSGDLSVVARTLQNASLASKHSAVFAANALLQTILRVKNCVAEERGCVTHALGAIAGTHADTLTNVGGRELELARIRDVHQQRIEELERDFDTQIRLLQAQLQHQGQYMHGGGVGGGARFGGNGAGLASRSLSRAGTHGEYMGLVGDDHKKTASEISPFDTLSYMSGQQRGNIKGQGTTGAGSAITAGGKSTTEGQPTRTIAVQTSLDINVLFPGMGFGSFADDRSVGSGAARRTASVANVNSGQGQGGRGGQPTGIANIEQLRSEEIDGPAVARMVSELLILEEANAVLSAENTMLKEERRRHLGFMRMGNVGAREQMLLANGGVSDLLLH